MLRNPSPSHTHQGLRDAAVTAASMVLENKDPLEVIKEEMIPSLDQVGREFAAGAFPSCFS